MGTYEHERNEFVQKFNADALDNYASDLEKAQEVAVYIFKLAAYLRSKTIGDITPEIKEFISERFAGPIISTAIIIADGYFLKIGNFNEKVNKKIQKEVVEKNPRLLLLFILLNRFHFIDNGKAPSGFDKIILRMNTDVTIFAMGKKKHYERYLKDKSKIEWIEINAIVEKLKIVDNPFDLEETNYEIIYIYDYNGIKYKYWYLVKLNTNHFGYAQRGELDGFPKIDFTLDDIVKTISPGQKLDIVVDKNNPYFHITYFDEKLALANNF